MKFVLLNAKICGIKNIKEKIFISFTKNNFGKELFEKSHIKTIYGPNGSGKSGIIHAFEIYKTLVLSQFPFKDSVFSSFFNKVCNVEKKEFLIEVAFAHIYKESIKRFLHRIKISIENDKPVFKKEELLLLNSRLEKSKTVFNVESGNLITKPTLYGDFECSKIDLINNSYVSLYMEYFLDLYKKNRAIRGEIKENSQTSSVILLMNFAINIIVSYGEKDDTHNGFSLASAKEREINGLFSVYALEHLSSALQNNLGHKYFMSIKPGEEKKTEKFCHTLAKFIKYLKPNIVDIVPNYKFFGNFINVDLLFVYKNKKKIYKIEYEFESAGVKKICTLYSTFLAANNGQIVFIDEIDSNVHDIFLTKLIEYFALYTDSQLIMTTHNVQLMESVKMLKKSIDFINIDNEIVPWTKIGKYSPIKIYLKGYIKNLPFELKSSEFGEFFSVNKKPKTEYENN